MNLTTIENGSSVTIGIEGRVDSSTAGIFEKQIESIMDNKTEVIIDLEKLEYISSAGLRVFLIAQKRMEKQGSMKVINVDADVMEIFNTVGFDDILKIE